MEDFKNRLLKMYRHFSKWARRRNIFAYRIYDRDIPQFPFSVDIYEDCLYICEYISETVTSRKNYEDWREEALSVINETTNIRKSNTFIRQRQRQKGNSQYEKLASTGNFMEVREGSLKFLVNLTDYLDTGLFLDHRPIREIIKNQSNGKRFLNLFCYTGAVSVYAAAGGASLTTSVDTSAVYLKWAENNFTLNNLQTTNRQMVEKDSRLFLDECPENSYDLIFCDPPVFSSGKKHYRDFDVLRDHPELVDSCLRVLSPGGVLYFSTNFKKFKLQWKGEFEDITKQSIPDDFKNQKIHVCYRIKK
jgi:23S rRNA (cytosine1962-C5)-methyltransferase